MEKITEKQKNELHNAVSQLQQLGSTVALVDSLRNNLKTINNLLMEIYNLKPGDSIDSNTGIITRKDKNEDKKIQKQED